MGIVLGKIMLSVWLGKITFFKKNKLYNQNFFTNHFFNETPKYTYA